MTQFIKDRSVCRRGPATQSLVFSETEEIKNWVMAGQNKRFTLWPEVSSQQEMADSVRSGQPFCDQQTLMHTFFGFSGACCKVTFLIFLVEGSTFACRIMRIPNHFFETKSRSKYISKFPLHDLQTFYLLHDL